MENHELTPQIDGATLALQVDRLRAAVLSDLTTLQQFQDAVHAWDRDFKVRLEERFGSRHYAQQVPAWQKLVGGSVEPETDISPAQRAFVLKEVQSFIERFAAEYDLTID